MWHFCPDSSVDAFSWKSCLTSLLWGSWIPHLAKSLLQAIAWVGSYLDSHGVVLRPGESSKLLAVGCLPPTALTCHHTQTPVMPSKDNMVSTTPMRAPLNLSVAKPLAPHSSLEPLTAEVRALGALSHGWGN